MDIKDILDKIEKKITGDLSKDGPYLKEQADKYKNTEYSEELERELSRILYEISEKEYKSNLYAFLERENSKTDEQLEEVEKRFKNKNYNRGIEILEEIIKNNIFGWLDTPDCTYKCFGTPLEYLLYKNIIETPETEKMIKPVNCNLAKVYSLYCHGLTQKSRYDEAYRAIERARQLNPVDPELYIYYIELAKLTNNKESLKLCCDMLLKVAVTKKQLGYAYFGYSFYYSEIKEFDKALALLQMSSIFRESDLYDTEYEYIISNMQPDAIKKYTAEQVMSIIIHENIQPGPSAAVVHLANTIANDFEKQNELKYARYFYDIVFELTEDTKTHEHILQIEKDIRG